MSKNIIVPRMCFSGYNPKRRPNEFRKGAERDKSFTLGEIAGGFVFTEHKAGLPLRLENLKNRNGS